MNIILVVDLCKTSYLDILGRVGMGILIHSTGSNDTMKIFLCFFNLQICGFLSLFMGHLHWQFTA